MRIARTIMPVRDRLPEYPICRGSSGP